jgi:hypothetical protein
MTLFDNIVFIRGTGERVRPQATGSEYPVISRLPLNYATINEGGAAPSRTEKNSRDLHFGNLARGAAGRFSGCRGHGPKQADGSRAGEIAGFLFLLVIITATILSHLSS